ncbi:CxxxxCH/CxxCH domain-containing protein [Amycolatopsis sp. NBRC 101858]|uniref:CxxxxCH/CxxCH domain-containing protein n=1 Tax=Amycolatopsis sp. NBRC 101858 TaxID=3032200 RepID=UPI003338685E
MTPWKSGPWNIQRSSYSWAAVVSGTCSAANCHGAGASAGYVWASSTVAWE